MDHPVHTYILAFNALFLMIYSVKTLYSNVLFFLFWCWRGRKLKNEKFHSPLHPFCTTVVYALINKFLLQIWAKFYVFQKPLMNRSGHVEMIRHCEVHMQQKTGCLCFRSWISKFPTRSKRIDVVSRIIFPLVFALFNISYWSTYLFRNEEEDQ